MTIEQQTQQRRQKINALRRKLHHDESDIRLGRFSMKDTMEMSRKVTHEQH